MPSSNSQPFYPRTLIVSPSVFNEFTGTGVFLNNLFRGWPSENLAIIHGDTFPPDFSVCKNILRLGRKELHPALPFGLLYRPIPQETSGPAPSQAAASAGALKKIIKPLLTAVLGPELPWTAHLTSELSSWIHRFQPEVIYTLVGGAYMKLAMDISARWKAPLVSHVMDDWAGQIQHRSLLVPFVRQRLLKDMVNLFQVSALRMGICDPMCEEYEKRYGLPFVAFQNSSDVERRLPGTRKTWNSGSVFRLCYVGSIVANAQLLSLIDVARAVATLRERGLSIEFHIYSPWAKTFEKELSLSPAIHLHPALEENTIYETLTSFADALLLPVNFDEASVVYIRYSMPAKIPLYLISGSPILVYGPPDVASVRYAEKAGWGYVVSDQSLEKLMAALQTLASDAALRQTLGQRAVDVARKNHDGQRVREEFRKKLAGLRSPR